MVAPIEYAEHQPVWLLPHGDERRREPGEVAEVKYREDGLRRHFYVVLTAKGRRYHAHHTEMGPRAPE